MTLVLGPVLFNWSADKLRDFYFRVADEAPVDIVHVGEVVCAKRWPFLAPHVPDIIERLQAGGKEVVLATPALISNEREMAEARALAADSELMIEVNDLSALGLAAGRPFVIGPYINVYNEATLGFFERAGAVRICLPPELPGTSLAVLARAAASRLELQVFGRMPLAISGRCFHARAHGLHKDGCQFVCGNDADGLSIRTLDAEPFVTVNGTQTLSHTCLDLAHELPTLRSFGFGAFRLSPQDCDMIAVARLFAGVLAGQLSGADATMTLRDILPHMSCSNGFFHATEGRLLVSSGRTGE